MLLKRIYDPQLAQASYLVGCRSEGTAIVIDPRRDVEVYLEEARRAGVDIVAVTETHIHADYLSGARELAARTGASLHLSAEGGPDWSYRFDHRPLRHGDELAVGNVTIRAVHTPGHTPEHLSFLVRDGAAADEPGYLVTGDFVFVGDVGRPDLLDEAAGGVDTRYPAARRLFASLRDRFLTLPDWVQVLPGHGAGSACGKALGSVDTTTVGYERRFAWWTDHLAKSDEDGFVRALLEGQPDAPSYFGRMKRQNRDGPALLGPLAELEALDPATLRGRIGKDVIFIDTRDPHAFRHDGVATSLHVPAGEAFATYASYVLDPEADPRPVVLLAGDRRAAHEMRDALLRVGIDRVAGFVTHLDGWERSRLESVPPADLGELDDAYVLDVRTSIEHAAGHVPGAHQLHVGRILQHLDDIPRDRPLVVHCQAGTRASVAESILRAAGFPRVLDLEGSYEGWARASAEPEASVPA